MILLATPPIAGGRGHGFRGRCSLCDACTIHAVSAHNAEKFFRQGVFVRVKKGGCK
jgi:hypothetical protein